MNIREKLDQSFQTIQHSPVLWKAWHECQNQQDRVLMLAQEVWDIAFQEGYEQGYKARDEDITMDG